MLRVYKINFNKQNTINVLYTSPFFNFKTLHQFLAYN